MVHISSKRCEAGQMQSWMFKPLSKRTVRGLLRKQLALLLHATYCSVEGEAKCTVPLCGNIKTLVSHMQQCEEGIMCDVNHCTTSAIVVNHWMKCTKEMCAVCKPINEIEDLLKAKKGRRFVELYIQTENREGKPQQPVAQPQEQLHYCDYHKAKNAEKTDAPRLVHSFSEEMSGKDKHTMHLLATINHAQKCGLRHIDVMKERRTCRLTRCRQTQDTLMHMETCKKGDTCTEENCTSLGKAMSHWTTCSTPDCKLCHVSKVVYKTHFDKKSPLVYYPYQSKSIDVEPQPDLSTKEPSSKHNLKRKVLLPEHLRKDHPKVNVDPCPQLSYSREMGKELVEYLKVLVHARDCRRSEGTGECTFERCGKTKHILSHVDTCTTETCSLPGCVTSTDLLIHWDSCTSPECLVCLPVCEELKVKKIIPLDD